MQKTNKELAVEMYCAITQANAIMKKGTLDERLEIIYNEEVDKVKNLMELLSKLKD